MEVFQGRRAAGAKAALECSRAHGPGPSEVGVPGAICICAVVVTLQQKRILSSSKTNPNLDFETEDANKDKKMNDEASVDL